MPQRSLTTVVTVTWSRDRELPGFALPPALRHWRILAHSLLTALSGNTVCRALTATESAEMDSDLGGRWTLRIYEVDILKRGHCDSGFRLLAGIPKDQVVWSQEIILSCVYLKHKMLQMWQRRRADNPTPCGKLSEFLTSFFFFHLEKLLSIIIQ